MDYHYQRKFRVATKWYGKRATSPGIRLIFANRFRVSGKYCPSVRHFCSPWCRARASSTGKVVNGWLNSTAGVPPRVIKESPRSLRVSSTPNKLRIPVARNEWYPTVKIAVSIWSHTLLFLYHFGLPHFPSLSLSAISISLLSARARSWIR